MFVIFPVFPVLRRQRCLISFPWKWSDFRSQWKTTLPGVTEGSSSTTAAGNVIRTAMFMQWTRHPNCSLNEPWDRTQRSRVFFFSYSFSHSLCVLQKGNTEIQQGSLRHLFALIWNMAELWDIVAHVILKTLQWPIFMPNCTSTSEFAPNADGGSDSPSGLHSASGRDVNKRRRRREEGGESLERSHVTHNLKLFSTHLWQLPFSVKCHNNKYIFHCKRKKGGRTNEPMWMSAQEDKYTSGDTACG